MTRRKVTLRSGSETPDFRREISGRPISRAMSPRQRPDGHYQLHHHANLVSRLSPVPQIEHAHERGDRPHTHPEYGPAFYGHLRQPYRFVRKPKGLELPWQAYDASFEVIVCDNPPGWKGEGGGMLAAERMIHGFKMRVSRIENRRTRRRG